MRNGIFIVTDEKYFKYTRACINSIETNWIHHPEIIVSYRTDKIIEDDFNFLREKKIIIKTYMELDFNLPLGPVNDNIVYQKFLLFGGDGYFNKFDNILFLDSDTLVLEDLDSIINASEFFIIQNYEDVPHIKVFGNVLSEGLIEKCCDNYIKSEDDMVNAGMFVIPKKYRTDMYFNTLLNLGREFSDYIKYADQSIISLWCKYFNIPIADHLGYNYQSTSSSLYNFGVKDIKIVHFSGIKPDDEKYLDWNWVNKDFAIETKKLFDEYK